jgi:hypothetical protein
MKRASLLLLPLLFAQAAALAATTLGDVTDRGIQPRRGTTNVGTPVATEAECWAALRAEAERRKASIATALCVQTKAAKITWAADLPPPPPPPPPPLEIGTWRNIAPGLMNPEFVPAQALAPDAAGVTFYVDGVLNRTDATADPYEVFPAVNLVDGSVLRAEWTSAGVRYVSSFVVGAAAPPPPPPPPAVGAAALTWDASPDPRAIGYRVYWGTAPGSYLQAYGQGVLVTGTSYAVTGLAGGATYYFAVTAVGDGIESGYSVEASKAVAP